MADVFVRRHCLACYCLAGKEEKWALQIRLACLFFRLPQHFRNDDRAAELVLHPIISTEVAAVLRKDNLGCLDA